MDSTDTPTALEAELPALRQRLLRQARLAVHDSAHAEDLVQDTLIAVVQQRPAFRGDAALSTWAISILRHKVADWYRSPQARREVQMPDGEGGRSTPHWPINSTRAVIGARAYPPGSSPTTRPSASR